jgi:HK97 gp10 family phage protein
MVERMEGFGNLRKTFDQLDRNLKQKIGPRMVAAGIGVWRKESKTIAQAKGLKITGALIRNIAIKRERKVPEGVIQYHLGVRHGRDLGRRAKKTLAVSKTGRVVTKRENDPFYWRFLEFGTKHIAAAEFIQQAPKNKRAEAIAAMEKKLQQEIAKANRLKTA